MSPSSSTCHGLGQYVCSDVHFAACPHRSAFRAINCYLFQNSIILWAHYLYIYLCIVDNSGSQYVAVIFTASTAFNRPYNLHLCSLFLTVFFSLNNLCLAMVCQTWNCRRVLLYCIVIFSNLNLIQFLAYVRLSQPEYLKSSIVSVVRYNVCSYWLFFRQMPPS